MRAIKKIVCLGLNGRGGTLHYASSLTSNLAELTKTSLLLPSYSDTSLISKKVNIIKIKAPPSAIKTIFLTFNIFQHIKAIKQINKERPDIINILDIHPWYIMYWHFLKTKKKVVTINDPELHSGEAGPVMTLLLKTITKFLLKNADEIIVLGKKQEETIRRLGYKQKVIVSRIGHYDFFMKKSKKKFKSESSTILFFGRIKEYKGLDYLLDALIQLKKEGKKFKCIIAGEGDIKPYKEKIAKLKENIELNNGYISDDKVSEYFQRVGFVVMPYTDATQTGVIQVAYSFGKPVIATNVGSLPELIEDGKTGLIIEKKNVVQLKKAIIKLLSNDPKLSEMKIQCRKFMKKLSWKEITKKLYKDLNS